MKMELNVDRRGVLLSHVQLTGKGSLRVEAPAKLADSTVILIGNSSVGAFSYCSDGCRIHNVRSIGRYCSIASNVTFQSGNHGTSLLSTSPVFTGGLNGLIADYVQIDNKWQKQIRAERDASFGRGYEITVGNDVWIGTGAIILAGLCVGDGAIIGAGAVVTHDVPPYSIVAGTPARIIRYRFDEPIIQELETLRWWDYQPEIMHGLSFVSVEKSISVLQERIYSGNYERYSGEQSVFEPVKKSL